MKIIVINKRKLQVIIVAIILMTVIFGTGQILEGHIKSVSFIQNNISSLKEYTALDGVLTYKLPSEWSSKTQSFPGNEIVYHNDFQSNDFVINGFVQVWNIKNDLKDFLIKSKEVSEKQNIIRNYKMNDIKINNRKGYSIKYNMLVNNTSYTVYEYFLKNNNQFIRVSFFIKSENFKESFVALFESIVKTVETK
ncbi:hypothetical protein [Clostridium ganghwense]|uniref:Uncharacterized protein n=1 Tax=Clostridium ganghwense TaxID=312089 RepID=A0ABT4CM39_9CLOT|nr:hypothetical protein [Clostridium ganghwense]MCY6370110.1 hypothetical protein [Clostridium ganghwense]